jgi:AcrR family transcriptional regulator
MQQEEERQERMTTASDSAIRKPGRPRSAQADQAILQATLEELTEMGIEAMSIEGVAARAGVGKTTIYRRWPSKEELIKAAVSIIHIQVPVLDTGNLYEDVYAMVRNTLEVTSRYPLLPKLFFRAVSEIKANPQFFTALQAQLTGPRIYHFVEMIEKAKARGEIRPELDTFVVLGAIMGPIISQWMFPEMAAFAQPFPDIQPSANLVEQIVESILRGIAAP